MNQFGIKIQRKLNKHVKNILLPLVMKQKKLLPENAGIIFSEARGGSTWLAEILNQQPGTIINYEPLAVQEDPLLKKLQFHWRQYIPENEDFPEAKKFFRSIFNGTTLNYSRSRLNTVQETANAEKIIVKFIRANGMLPWLVKQFDFNHKPIYLIRNPYAVIASQLKFTDWYKPVEQFEIPVCPYNDIYYNHQEFIKSIQSKEEYLAFMWCMINSIPLKHPDNNQSWITVNYENLVLQPKKELRRICDTWNMTLNQEMIDKIDRPSFAVYDDAPLEGKEQLEKWKTYLSDEQKNKIERVLHYFDIKEYSQNTVPLINYQ